MQILGLADSTPEPESRLKSLFWPSIRSAADVDYLGAQGYWVCAIVAGVSFLFLLVAGAPLAGILIGLFYYLGGVGVRQRSIYSAAAVLLLFTFDTFFSAIIMPSAGLVIRILLNALLFSNFRATVMSAQWKPDSEEAALPPRLSETWGDKFADQFPTWFWPKVRFPYYIFSAGFLVLVDVRMAIAVARRLWFHG